MKSTYIATALFETLADHAALFAGSPDKLDLLRNMLGCLPLPVHRLDTLADRLTRLDPCPVTGRVTSNETRVCLGEHGDIWPNLIWGAVQLANYESDLTRHRQLSKLTG